MSTSVQGNISDETGSTIVQVRTSYHSFIEIPQRKPLETPQSLHTPPA
jgi:hypothetical protein